MFGGYAVALAPRSHGVDRHPALSRDMIVFQGCDDLRMRPHPTIMHYALSQRKRLLHYSPMYLSGVKTPNERLRLAREQAGYATAVQAAEALGLPVSTYIGHENGHRGFPAKRAPQYARKFKVSEEWLLYGKGDSAAPSPDPSVAELVQMIDEALDELPLEVKRADLPRIVAPILHEQLERYRADRERIAIAGEGTVHGKAARSQLPTKPGV